MQPAKKEDGLESFLNEKNDITLKDLLKDAPFQQVRWLDLLAKAGFTESSEDERWRQKWLLSGANVRYYWLPLFQFDRTRGCFTLPAAPDTALLELTNKKAWPDWNSGEMHSPAQQWRFKILCVFVGRKDSLRTNDSGTVLKGHAERLHWELSNGVLFIFIP